MQVGRAFIIPNPAMHLQCTSSQCSNQSRNQEVMPGGLLRFGDKDVWETPLETYCARVSPWKRPHSTRIVCGRQAGLACPRVTGPNPWIIITP